MSHPKPQINRVGRTVVWLSCLALGLLLGNSRRIFSSYQDTDTAVESHADQDIYDALKTVIDERDELALKLKQVQAEQPEELPAPHVTLDLDSIPDEIQDDHIIGDIRIPVGDTVERYFLCSYTVMSAGFRFHGYDEQHNLLQVVVNGGVVLRMPVDHVIIEEP